MQTSSLANAYDALYQAEQIEFKELIVDRFPRHRNEVLVKLAGSGQRVLEIGCGGGYVLYSLRHRFTELYGVDLSPTRVEKLHSRSQELELNLQFRAGNIEDGLVFPDGFFDVILWADVIEHVVDLWAAMAEVRRLLANQGRLITCTPNIAGWRHRLKLLSGKFPSTASTDEGFGVRPGELYDGGHLHYFTFSSLAKLYRKYGIEPTGSMGFGRLGHFHNIYPPLLSSAVCLVGCKKS